MNDEMRGAPFGLAAFEAMLDRHGGDQARWPSELRERAEGLLASSPEAQAVLRDAKQLDAALAEALAVPSPAMGLRARIVANAQPRDVWLDWLTSRLWRPVSLACAPLLVGFAAGAFTMLEGGVDLLEESALVAFTTDLADDELADWSDG